MISLILIFGFLCRSSIFWYPDDREIYNSNVLRLLWAELADSMDHYLSLIFCETKIWCRFPKHKISYHLKLRSPLELADSMDHRVRIGEGNVWFHIPPTSLQKSSYHTDTDCNRLDFSQPHAGRGWSVTAWIIASEWFHIPAPHKSQTRVHRINCSQPHKLWLFQCLLISKYWLVTKCDSFSPLSKSMHALVLVIWGSHQKVFDHWSGLILSDLRILIIFMIYMMVNMTRHC